MKILKTTLLITGLIFMSTIAHANTAIKKDINHSAEKIIKRSLKFPDACYLQDQKVEILFSTNETGKVNFVLVKTADPILKTEIEKQFYSLQFQNFQQDVVNSVTVNFKTLK